MKVIIAGSRTLVDIKTVYKIIERSGFKISEVVSGCSHGVDKIGELWAKERGVPIKLFPADWARHDKAAGPIRNQQMVDYADALIAIYDRKITKGTSDTVRKAQKKNIPVYCEVVT